MPSKFHSHGKLLLTAEYVVLEGAKALATPTKFGQEMEVVSIPEKQIQWTALDEKGNPWFEGIFSFSPKIEARQNNPISKNLTGILSEANKLNPKILQGNTGFKITTRLEFPTNWGLGASSTLLKNIAQWFEIDAFALSEKTFGGSGYDIACAQRDSPIVYQLQKGERPKIREVNFNPPFYNELFFVHLNQKQDSREAIQHYRHQERKELKKALEEISGITDLILSCDQLDDFEKLISEHERIIASLLNIKPIKTRFFKDYPKAIKSLGGWGGDFILAVGGEREREYFSKKGFSTILGFDEMVF
jgi:mevalonate kinase